MEAKIPIPKKGETKHDFMQRCIAILVEEGRDQDQATAIGRAQWDNKFDLARSMDKKFKSINQVIKK